MKKGLTILGGILGALIGVAGFILVTELVFDSNRYSTKLGALCLIGGAMAGSSLADFLTGANKGGEEASAAKDPSLEDQRRQRALWEAIERNDGEELEGLRDLIQPVDVPALAARWSPGASWAIKEALICVLMDQTAQKYPELAPIFKDGLKAPGFEVRRYAYCCLTGDFDAFTELLNGDEELLQSKIKARGLS